MRLRSALLDNRRHIPNNGSVPFPPFGSPPAPRGSRRAPVLVDLFAGCGGLGLGLELAGFSPIFVNELDPGAMATYVGNRLRRQPLLVESNCRDIAELTAGIAAGGPKDRLNDWATTLRKEHGDIDLVSGGPPCQGYSAIGHRRTFPVERHEVPSNHLYRDMAWVIEALRPRMFLFENVANLERAKWHSDGNAGEIWTDVLGTFGALDDYEVQPAKVYARDYGVPQNRPRLLIVGIRRDLGFVREFGKPAFGLLPDPTGGYPDPADFLGDLVDTEFRGGGRTARYPRNAETGVQEWYRYDPISRSTLVRGDIVTEHDYSKHHDWIVAKFRHMIATGGDIRLGDRTNKFSQRVLPAHWGPKGPNITATSMPDDFVHYLQPRTLTVREWARLQTFPDWYQFFGKRTTGGQRRAGNPDENNWKRDVPKYTQIGNAVPVLLAKALGDHFLGFLG